MHDRTMGSRRLLLACGAASAALMTAAPALAAPVDIAAQPADSALRALAQQTNTDILFQPQAVAGLRSPAIRADITVEEAARQILAGGNLRVMRDPAGALIVQAAQGPQGGSAGGDVEALIVTAQKREENIQDVPIAISAFSQEDLTRSQVAGGPDLITQVPNMTFTKTNFSSYSVQLRGIGTQAISATTDPAVAVAFNNTPFIRNRFFEQEFYDLQRVEVLRGPQGTLYGRNATAGVVNIISAKPKFVYEAKLSADVSNYNSTRIEGMVNIPLAEDVAALRIAGAWTKRDGYATNELSGNPIDGRDLWSTRVSLRVAPNDAIDVNLIWEHFEENDDRLRSGKQLCKKHVVTDVGGIATPDIFQTIPDRGQSGLLSGVQATFSQGCERESLYSPDSFQTPNGQMLPYYAPLGGIGLPVAKKAPYVSEFQTPDLRVIESTIDPDYRAKADVIEVQGSFDITDSLTLSSETAYGADWVWSMQDFNRFNTAPGAWLNPEQVSSPRPGVLTHGPDGGIFCDPQLGCSDRLVAVDISTAKARQFSQEFRLGSDFDGPFNFSLGANFLRADSEDKYYVFINSLTLIAADNLTAAQPGPYVSGQTDNLDCMPGGGMGDPNRAYNVTSCVYIDPNPIGSLNDQGHNYFLSKNPYKLISYAAFGEIYYNFTEDLKITGGLRWTVDKKEAPRIPTWILGSQSVGYPVAEVIEQEWNEPTGRLALDWKPDLGFTDETLLYASYAHGYKAGGSNPPGYVRVYYGDGDKEAAEGQNAASATRPRTFDAEFVDAFELGSKNTLADGRVTLNLAAFYYDYTGYQVSEIVDRSAFNRNFDATVWGVELEADWRPLENLRLGLKGGYEKTRIKDGEEAIDLMDRTAGHDDWVVVRPFPTMASSCILPAYVFVQNGVVKNPGGISGGGPGACEIAYSFGYDPVTYAPYGDITDPNQFEWPFTGYTGYPGFDPFDASQGHNFGEGFVKQLGGNELPNAPNWTWTITGDYTVPLPNEWLATLHTDLHWQSESWWRVFNDHEYDKLDEYFTMNVAAIFTNEEAGWNVMAYVKNVTDETAITGAFLNSDDTGLTTNVFLTEPRLYGVRVTKNFTGGSLLGSFGERGEGPFPLTIELGGQIQRHDAPYETLQPSFAGAFSPMIATANPQNQDLDWGDGREVKLTYALPGGSWRLSAAARVGKTNRGSRTIEQEPDELGCVWDKIYCPPYVSYERYILRAVSYNNSTVSDREDHKLIDFGVGRDVGIGAFGMGSTLTGGLRYAEFKSRSHLDMVGEPDWYVPDSYAFNGDWTHHRYQADILAEREFKGFGPTLSWDASKRLAGADDNSLDLDWSVQGGVLFGKQKTFVNGEERAAYFKGPKYYQGYVLNQVGPTVVTPVAAQRTSSVTVPTLGASLGFSYTVGPLSVGAGYRWERYFDVLDAGYATAKDADRTIDGPYFKLSVGFGG